MPASENQQPGTAGLDQPRSETAGSPGSPAGSPGSPAGSRSGLGAGRLLKLGGVLIAVLAVALCAVTLIREWSSIRHSIATANPGLLLVSLLCAGAAMSGLGVLWWRCLHVFGAPARLQDAVAWYFGGELGKYVPGGVWPVLGRGELASRAGIARGTGYLTTLISYAAMCVAAAFVCGLLAPFVALDGAGLSWGWLMLAFIPIGIGALHPAVLGKVLALGAKLTRGRVAIQARSWSTMMGLTAWSVATWLLVGATSVGVTAALGYSEQPARVAFAAVAAWIIGFLAIPVPAGAGLRELIFVAISGLDTGPAVAVAAIARLLFIVVDAAGGVIGLWLARRSAATPMVQPVL